MAWGMLRAWGKVPAVGAASLGSRGAATPAPPAPPAAGLGGWGGGGGAGGWGGGGGGGKRGGGGARAEGLWVEGLKVLAMAWVKALAAWAQCRVASLGSRRAATAASPCANGFRG